MADFKLDRIRFRWKNEWTISTAYIKDDIVYYDGKAYVCIEGHTSKPDNFYLDLNDSTPKWELMLDGVVWKGDWEASTFYSLGNIVKFKGYLYQCKVAHTSTIVENLGPESVLDNWDVIAVGYNWLDDWTTDTFYNKGDVVKYSGITYISNTAHRSSETESDGLETDSEKWDIVTRSDNWLTDWTTSTRYRVDDIVRYGAQIYRCTGAHTSAETDTDGLEANQGSWTLVVEGIEYKGEWQASDSSADPQVLGFRYKENDIVKHNHSLWICTQYHTSDDSFIFDESNWQVWLPGLGYETLWSSSIEYKKGDIVLYGGYTYTALRNNISSTPSINGKLQDTGDWELLKEGYKFQGDWDNTTNYLTGDVIRNNGYVYVATADNSAQQPDQENSWELLVPGSHWKAEWNDDVTYYKGDIVTFESTAYICIARHQSTSSDSRPDLDVLQDDQDYWQVLIAGAPTNVLTTIGDIRTHDGTETSRFALGNPGNALKATDAGLIWQNFEEVTKVFYVSTEGKDLPGNGRTVSAPFRTIRFACNYILNNIDTANENTTLFIKTGIYEEVTPISVPANCALVGDELRSTVVQPAEGFEESDMFYVRNGSGIRNMTLQGLFGVLGEPNEYGTRRPSAGAFVGLDPGEGPDDESVWIKTKSCYVQNVTTFGTGCIGMLIDGALHNGGNRSIVANDFTQVVSDGISYWADNVGRSELVSVFTYYAYIGYLSTNGGILRATNGNNSYGTFGSRAEGVNESEIPITAKTDNRNNEAEPYVVYTDGDNILSLGYTHAGQEYSEASISFTGTGASASASFEEFRHQAISQIRKIDPADSTKPGGINYQTLLNNAQGGSRTTITLSAADTTGTTEKYVGMRIFIEAGKGVGQYGIITGYNAETKVCNISREFDFTAGWQHSYPGYPIEPLLDSTTRYRIEPRVIIEPPVVDSIGIGGNDGSTYWDTSAYGDGFLHFAGQGSSPTVAYHDGDTLQDSQTLTTSSSISDIVYTGSKILYLEGNNSGTGETGNIVHQTDPNALSFTPRTLPSTSEWCEMASDGNGTVIAIQYRATDIAISTNHGTSWIAGSTGTGILPQSIAYGNGTWVIVGAGNDIAYSTDDGSNWTVINGAITSGEWAVVYGNGRFVALDGSNGTAAVSFNGITWNTYTEPGGNLSIFDRLVYGGGVFIAFSDNGNSFAKSQDGVSWRQIDEDSTIYKIDEAGVSNAVIEYDSSNGNFIAAPLENQNFYKLHVGAQPLVRAVVQSSRIEEFVVYDPGSNYRITPSVTVFDPVNTVDVQFSVRLNDGVLAQPVWQNRGTGYTSAISTISGDGFADIFQVGNTLRVSNLSKIPGPGDNLEIDGIDEVIYRVVSIENVSGSEPNYSATINISPSIGNQESPIDDQDIIIRQQYSQVRLTGHDFLDIGTGNFNSTRYPELYIFGQTSENVTQPQNEVTEIDGGRVFYTSTDQDGNFRVGELFKVEQSTGIVSISADFFELDGLEEISLGGIVVGGSAVVIREFSKEPTFIANSNNVVPTQRAITRYLESRISSGGSDAITNTLIAGQVRVSGTTIGMNSENPINFTVKANHTGGISGDYLSLQYFGAQ